MENEAVSKKKIPCSPSLLSERSRFQVIPESSSSFKKVEVSGNGVSRSPESPWGCCWELPDDQLCPTLKSSSDNAANAESWNTKLSSFPKSNFSCVTPTGLGLSSIKLAELSSKARFTNSRNERGLSKISDEFLFSIRDLRLCSSGEECFEEQELTVPLAGDPGVTLVGAMGSSSSPGLLNRDNPSKTRSLNGFSSFASSSMQLVHPQGGLSGGESMYLAQVLNSRIIRCRFWLPITYSIATWSLISCSSLGYSCGPCTEESKTSIHNKIDQFFTQQSAFRTKIHDFFVHTDHRTKTTQQFGPYVKLL